MRPPILRERSVVPNLQTGAAMVTKYTFIFFSGMIAAALSSNAFAYYRCDNAKGGHRFTSSHCNADEVETEFDQHGDEVQHGPKTPVIGMTSDEAKKLKWPWGPPSRINVTTTSRGIDEQWCYTEGYDNRYLYFRNGVLTSIHDNK